MRRNTRTSARVAQLLISAAASTVALAGCSDQQPLGGSAEAIPAAPPLRVLQAFDCIASIEGAVDCRPASARGGGASKVVIGGQGVNLQLAGSNVSYDSVSEILEMDVTLKNLMNEAIGTPDGVVADPDGIIVFFSQEPIAFPTGSASVNNPDGFGFFTSPDQPYFTYSEILAKNATSAPKTWRFDLSPSATSIQFSVLLETDVQYLLVINEVLVNPGGTISDANGEWFEVYNAGSLSVNLQGLAIADSSSTGLQPYHTIASSVSLAPGGYAVLGNTTNTTSNGGVTVNYAYGSALLLSNSVDAVKISRAYGADTLTLDRTAYASATISAKNGISRELINPTLDNSNMDGSNWADASAGSVYGTGGRGTPGAQNSAFVP